LDDILSKTELLVLEDSIRIQLVPERVYAARAIPDAAETEKLKSMEKELGEVKSREAKTRTTASVFVFASIAASIAAVLLSQKSL